jgi:hypothetical protein
MFPSHLTDVQVFVTALLISGLLTLGGLALCWTLFPSAPDDQDYV